MGFDFSKKKAKPEKPSRAKDAPDQESEEYRERAKQERDRFKLSTDGDIWCCFCFKDAEDMGRFDALTGSCKRIAPGTVVESALDGIMERSTKRMGRVKNIPLSPASVNPYDSVQYTGNLEKDCIAEAMAVFEAFRSYKPQNSYKNVYDSAYWRCFVFSSNSDMMRFIQQFRLAMFGDKYLDGSAFLRRHGL